MHHQRAILAILVMLLIHPQFLPLPLKNAQTSPISQTVLPIWRDAQQKGSIVYFLYQDPNIIRRYDLATQTWLENINLPFPPVAFRVDDALYIAFDVNVSRFNLDGSNEQQLTSVSGLVNSLLVGGDFLFVHFDTDDYMQDCIRSIRKDTGEFIDEKQYTKAFTGMIIAPSLGKLFGTTIGIDPVHALSFSYNVDGTLGPMEDGPYAFYNNWMFPSESFLFSSSGGILNTIDLTLRANIPPPHYYTNGAEDVIFYGEQIVVLWDGNIIGYDEALIQRGDFVPDIKPLRIFLFNQTIYSVSYIDGIHFETYPLIRLNFYPPGQSIDPLGLKFTPDDVAMGQGDILYLLSRKYKSIFRWSVLSRQYLNPIPLEQIPSFMAYMPYGNRIYLAYETGKINVIRLDETMTEEPYIMLPGEPFGLLAAGDYLFTAYFTTQGFNQTYYHATFNSNGVNIHTTIGNNSFAWQWNEAKQRMYLRNGFPADPTMMWEAIGIDGTIGETFISSVNDKIVEVRPDGTLVLAESGKLFNGDNFVPIGTLSNTIFDAIWVNGALYTIRNVDNDTQIQQWDNDYKVFNDFDVSGVPFYIFSAANGLVVVTDQNSKLRFYLLDLNLNLLASPPTAAFGCNPQYGDHPLQVTFTNYSTPLDEITSYRWDFGDGQTSSEENPVHTYQYPRVYTIKLTVVGPGGQDAYISEGLVFPYPITLSIMANVQHGSVPLSVNFTSTAVGGPVDTYLWDFGDGESSTDAKPTHLYTQSGLFSVRLTVNGPGGETSHIEFSFIEVLPVTAAFTASKHFGPTPLLVQFTNQSTGGPFENYLWKFGDGKTSIEANPVHLYEQRGSYTVTLTVSGIYGEDTFTADLPIKVVYGVFLPIISLPQYTKPGLYTFNRCTTYDLILYGDTIGKMTECVKSVEVLSNGHMKHNFSWKLQQNPAATGCVTKYSDANNTNMYITDGSSLRYDHIDTGGAANETIYCMYSGYTYDGWFLFPSARSALTTYTFHDDDAQIIIGQLAIPGK